MYDVIFFIVVWIFIPLVLGAMLLFAIILAVGAGQLGGFCGILAGFILFAVYVATQAPIAVAPPGLQSPPGTAPVVLDPTIVTNGFNFEPIPAGLGFALGFVTPWIVKTFRDNESLVGVLTLLFTGAGTLALFNYFFLNQFRVVTILLALGALLGVLIHFVLVPSTLRDTA